MQVTGSCLCAGIQYQVTIFPEKTFNCHCQFCRKAHGSAFATLTLADGKSLLINTGETLLTEHKNAIGGFRAFCRQCGSRLFNYAADKSVYFSVTLSTIDSPVDCLPVAHVNTESKACWHQPDTSIPSFDGLPNGIV